MSNLNIEVVALGGSAVHYNSLQLLCYYINMHGTNWLLFSGGTYLIDYVLYIQTCLMDCVFNISGSKAHKELKLIIANKRLLSDIKKLSPAEQTSRLEAQHKVVCQFAPKFHSFSYSVMEKRYMHSNPKLFLKE